MLQLTAVRVPLLGSASKHRPGGGKGLRSRCQCDVRAGQGEVAVGAFMTAMAPRAEISAQNAKLAAKPQVPGRT